MLYFSANFFSNVCHNVESLRGSIAFVYTLSGSNILSISTCIISHIPEHVGHAHSCLFAEKCCGVNSGYVISHSAQYILSVNRVIQLFSSFCFSNSVVNTPNFFVSQRIFMISSFNLAIFLLSIVTRSYIQYMFIGK
jgi:hypothetical protein